MDIARGVWDRWGAGQKLRSELKLSVKGLRLGVMLLSQLQRRYSSGAIFVRCCRGVAMSKPAAFSLLQCYSILSLPAVTTEGQNSCKTPGTEWLLRLLRKVLPPSSIWILVHQGTLGTCP